MAVEELFRAGAAPAELRAAVDVAIAEGNFARARLLVQWTWALHRGPAQAGFVSQRWEKCAPATFTDTARVHVLRSFTIEPVLPVVRSGALVAGLDLNLTVGGFNTFAQEILDPSSSLYGADHPDAVVLAVHTRDVAPELWSGTPSDSSARRDVVERVVEELAVLLTAFRGRSTAPLIVNGLELPTRLSLGVADMREPLGQRAAIRAINDELVILASEMSDVHIVDWDAAVASIGHGESCNERKWQSMRMPLSPVGVTALADAWLAVLHPALRRLAKCIVVDLDNTMWGGILGEDGVDALALGDDGPGWSFLELQRALLGLRNRGVLLAVCSKNDHEDAVRAIDDHPEMLLRCDDFHALRINWIDKATNLREIADELNIGVDSLVFLDDNPAERLLVATQLPEVHVLPVGDDPTTFGDAVRSCHLFERLELTSEDRQRSDYYVQQRQRTQSRAVGASLDDYLRSLGTHVTVRLVQDEEVARVAQLTQKTNQFNMTTHRFSEQEVRSMALVDAWRIYVLRAADRFGDHGLVATAFVEVTSDQWRVDNALMSCRVIGRDAETALIRAIAIDARAAGATSVVGEYTATKKNGPACDFYERHGFVRQPHGLAEEWSVDERWGLDPSQTMIELPEWIEMLSSTSVSQGEP